MTSAWLRDLRAQRFDLGLPAFCNEPGLHGRRGGPGRRSPPEHRECLPELVNLICARAIIEIALEARGVEPEKIVNFLDQPEDLFLS